MPQIVYDVIVWINIIAFVFVGIDKAARGRFTTLFWLVTLFFGSAGSAIGCHVFHHRTLNGDAGAAKFLILIHFGILYLLERIF